MTPTTKAHLTHQAITALSNLADTATRIPFIGYHAATAIHRQSLALRPLYRHWLRQAAQQAAAELEQATQPTWSER